MASLSVRETIRRERRQASEHERGVAPSVAVRFNSARLAESSIVSVVQLPVARRTGQIQDAQGRFLYDPLYSDPLGPDVGAPGEGE